jgi:hypothetical protein
LGLGSATGAARVLSGASRILVVQGRSNDIERYAPTGVEMGQMSVGQIQNGFVFLLLNNIFLFLILDACLSKLIPN